MAENQREQIALHRRVAHGYERRYGDAASRAFHRAWHAELALELPRGARVLEIGCGTGELLADLAAREDLRLRVLGLDLSADMLERARARARDAALVRGDGERLPFAARSFDALLLKGCLHHLRDHAGFLAEARRVLRAGGRLVLSEPIEDAPWIRLARRALHRLRAHAFDREDRAFRTRELERLCRGAGFALEASRPFGWAAYALAGFPDHLPALRYLPGKGLLARGLLALDAAVLALPPASILSFQRVIVARAPEESA